MRDKSRFLIKPDFNVQEFIQVTPQIAKWEHLNYSAVRLSRGNSWIKKTEGNEMAVVILSGSVKLETADGEWERAGTRSSVFAGMPTTLYVSKNKWVKITAISDEADLGVGWCLAYNDHPTRLIPPEAVKVELRGGGNASRQINQMIMPGFDCDRLIVVEVYTPSGNWSSYPPHKHDKRTIDQAGKVLEADLEEVYYYKIDKPEGYAYQRVYTSDRRLDELIMVQDNELVLSPEGYHPVVAAHGYNVYYLNMLAGSDQSLASTDDPTYAWVKNSWTSLDPRLPIVSLHMNKE
jgi:5-deoxy-glucuronate isomerase